MPTHYWLFKSEPETFGIQHLAKRPKQTEPLEWGAEFSSAEYVAR